MNDYPEPPDYPPTDYDALIPPDFPDEDDYAPFPPDDFRGEVATHGQAPPLSPTQDHDWGWYDSRLIGVDRGESAGVQRYEIGAVDLYASTTTGDVGGSYLPVAGFPDEQTAIDHYHDLQEAFDATGEPPYRLPAFAQDRAPSAQWRGAEPAEYEAYDTLRELDSFDPAHADDPPPSVLDPLLQTAVALGGVITEHDIPDDHAAQALNAIGVQAHGFSMSGDPPPFFDPESGTAYWIGVFQPDQDDRENCVASILSLGRNPETGEMEAQLAPCVPGDWDKAYSAAEYLIQVAGKGDIEQVFDTAEGMALATDQRDFWDTGRGVTLEPQTTREIADYTREQWEMEL